MGIVNAGRPPAYSFNTSFYGSAIGLLADLSTPSEIRQVMASPPCSLIVFHWFLRFDNMISLSVIRPKADQTTVHWYDGSFYGKHGHHDGYF